MYLQPTKAPDPVCTYCEEDKELNGVPEKLISCADCGSSGKLLCGTDVNFLLLIYCSFTGTVVGQLFKIFRSIFYVTRRKSGYLNNEPVEKIINFPNSFIETHHPLSSHRRETYFYSRPRTRPQK